MLDLLSIGDIKLDTFILVPHASVLCRYKEVTCELCIAHGKKIPVDHIDIQIAGSAPNVAIGVKRLGFQSAVLSTMGHDSTFAEAKRFLKQQGVKRGYIYGKRGTRSSFSAVLNYQGESTQLAAHSQIDYTLPLYWPKSKWVHISELGNNTNALFSRILKEKSRQGFKLSFNPGAVQLEKRDHLFNEILRHTDLLFVNELEAGIILGQTYSAPEACRALFAITGGTVIVTAGKNGAYSYDGHLTFFAPLFPGDRIEATGAGDAYSSGVIAGLLKGLSLPDAMAWGAVDAASVVQFTGGTKGLLPKASIINTLRNSKDYHVNPV